MASGTRFVSSTKVSGSNPRLSSQQPSTVTVVPPRRTLQEFDLDVLAHNTAMVLLPQSTAPFSTWPNMPSLHNFASVLSFFFCTVCLFSSFLPLVQNDRGAYGEVGFSALNVFCRRSLLWRFLCAWATSSEYAFSGSQGVTMVILVAAVNKTHTCRH